MIHYNTIEGSKERQHTKPLTIKQEEKVIKIINDMLDYNIQYNRLFKESGEELLQKFINHYQNMSHHMSTTCGLWACDRKPLDPRDKQDFFQIKF